MISLGCSNLPIYKYLSIFRNIQSSIFMSKMATVAEHVPFTDLCSLCERICKKKGKDKQEPLRDFIQRWRSFHNKLHQNNSSTTDSFFPVLRLLLPQCERERAAYGIKEVTLAKLFISIFCLDKNSVDAQKLLNYRLPKNATQEGSDFASIAYFVLKKRCPEKGSLKIHDVNYHLDGISTSNALKDKDAVQTNLQYLLRNTSALEQKWLIRMILKDMRLGTSEHSMLKTFHPDGQELYNVTSSLEKVCCQLREPSKRLHEIEISLFTPFRPMLSEQVVPLQAEKIMPIKPFIVEIKYDGERLQLHKDGDMYKYFSRGGFDCTELYGGSPLKGTLTPHIANAFKANVKSCILDGEVVIYSSKLNLIVSKGQNADVRALQPDGDYGPCLCVFDILMLNNRVLSNLPLTERVAHIRNSFTPIENRLRYTEQLYCSTKEEVVAELNKAIDKREEGLILKNPMSIYKPNIRKHGGWFKVKPEYVDNLMDELDLLIIGGYFGEGRRSSMISHFLVAVCSPPETPGDEPNVFHSFCKVGSGYSFNELYELQGKLSNHWQPYDARKKPKGLLIGGGKSEQPNVWIEPSKSQIVQVKATEIVRSDNFATHCTLRFPRVEMIRYDKPWHQCMTTEELKDLRKQADGSLATQHCSTANPVEDEEEPSPKKAKRTQRENVRTIAPHFRPADVTNVQQVSSLFSNKEMCVISSSPQKKQQIEKLIVQYGGKFVQNPSLETFCVIADKVTAKVQNIMSTKSYDVVRSEWFSACIEQKAIVPWVPDDMLHSTEATLANFAKYFDDYGDSYTEDATLQSLKLVFNKISKEKWQSENITERDIADLEQQYFSEPSTYGLFRICRVCIVNPENLEHCNDFVSDQLKLTRIKLKLYGAELMSDIDENTTHVVIHSSDTQNVKELRKLAARQRRGRFHIVTEKWVDGSIRSNRLLTERFH